MGSGCMQVLDQEKCLDYHRYWHFRGVHKVQYMIPVLLVTSLYTSTITYVKYENIFIRPKNYLPSSVIDKLTCMFKLTQIINSADLVHLSLPG